MFYIHILKFLTLSKFDDALLDMNRSQCFSVHLININGIDG